MVSAGGAEVLMHVGIDTVKLGGKYFEVHVSDGQEVKKGDLLLTFDIEQIKAAGYKVTTPMMICNTDDYAAVEQLKEGETAAGENIIKITK